MHPHLRPTRSVLDIARRLEQAGFEAWCVGGAIRDALLGYDPLDWDLATSATPDQVLELFGRRRTIPVGIEFGTVAVLDDVGVPHEVTTFRRDVKTDGRHAVVEFGASLEEDLSRRDLTINAIAYRPKNDQLRDPFRGIHDIDSRIVRSVGDPEQRMREDRLRALRAIRLAARYDFTIEPKTLEAIRNSAPFLTRLSAERVQQEIVKTMEQVERPAAALTMWRSSGALAVLIPALREIDDTALATLDCLPRHGAGTRTVPQRMTNRVAALFLDCSPQQARVALTELRFSKHEISWSVAMVDRWNAVGRGIAETLSSRAPTDVVVRRWLASLGRIYAGGFLRIASARWSAMRERGLPAPSAKAVHLLHRRMRAALYRDPIEIADLAIGGDELRRQGIPAGPVYAKILDALLEHVLESPARNTPEALLEEVPRLLARLGEQRSTT